MHNYKRILFSTFSLLLSASAVSCQTIQEPPFSTPAPEKQSIASTADNTFSSEQTISDETAAKESENALFDSEDYYAYHSLSAEEQTVYQEIYSGLLQYSENISVSPFDDDLIFRAFQAVLIDCPEFFWIDGGGQINTTTSGFKVTKILTPDMNTKTEDIFQIKARIEEEADKCVFAAPVGSDYEKVKYVYEYLINLVDYRTDSPNNQNIQSVFLNHQSVCSGYAKATQYLLKRLGIFCTYVSGVSNGEAHAWNLAKIDGNYVWVDTTWGDPVFEGSSDSNHISYNYLCSTDEELANTHQADNFLPLPSCHSPQYNYYRQTDRYFDTYDEDRIYNLFIQDIDMEKESSSLKFDNEALFQEACSSMLTESGVIERACQYYMEAHGLTSYSYYYNSDDPFYVITVYWE